MNRPRIEIAPQDLSDTFEAEVNELVRVMGHEGALVTDESQVSDFLIYLGKEHENDPEIVAFNNKALDGLKALLTRDVAPKEKMAEVARELYHLRQQEYIPAPQMRH